MFMTFRELDRIRDEINNIFNASDYYVRESFPLTNIYEDENNLFVLAELPGVLKENIDISLKGDNLIISGQREEKRYGEKVITLRKELNSGEFTKTLTLNAKIAQEQIKAKLEDGILTLTLPKSEEAKPRKIEIKA